MSRKKGKVNKKFSRNEKYYLILIFRPKNFIKLTPCLKQHLVFALQPSKIDEKNNIFYFRFYSKNCPWPSDN